ncbi:MAG: PaaI family thioesterase [Candidatus Methylomirabilales bacterium]
MAWENDDMCFVCGQRNEHGLQLRFQLVGSDRIRTEFTPEKRFQGFKDIVHGGIVATVLDEVMVDVAYLRGILAVTSKLEVRLKKPAKVGEKLLFEARILKDRGRLLDVEAQARKEDGMVVAEAKAVLVKVKCD